ncbi:MAG: xanthine dehydrogenase family protein molybdopterin-binding subunit [Sediminibacterium sp.]|nr:xanthine dehydrogenase family protein molybdopterin-binding subunit [Sediminibacterium sp.]
MYNNINTTILQDERVDGADKTNGKAKYTAEYQLPNLAYGVFVTSNIAKGTIKELDISKAIAAPGVLDVIYYANCPAVPGYNPNASERPKNVNEWRGHKVLYDNKVRFFGQPIALIVADSFENANAAIRLVKTVYDKEEHETNFDVLRKDPTKLKPAVTYKRGQEKAFATASKFIEAEYNIPIEVHLPMEMHATIAYWEGEDKITLYDKTQGPKSTQSTVARTFGLQEKNVRVIAENVGGGFGSGLRSWANVPAACIASKKLNRPVKIVLTRPQMFNLAGYRPQSWQKIGIGADASGKFIGITHEAISNTSKYEDFREGIVNVSRFLYAVDNVDTKYNVLPLDLSTPIWMRGPGEASGCFALESAIDELSYQLNMDPIDLRIKNFTDINPENKMPFSAINLKDCYAYGKEKIGWKNRPNKPGTLKENGMHIGYGMAVGVFGAGKGTASVRALFSKDGRLVLECAVSDMGPGTTTSMTKIASTSMQMPLDKIKFKLGDSDFPAGPSQGGSGTTSTVGSAVDMACKTLQQNLKELAIQFAPSFANKLITEMEVKNEYIYLTTDASVKISVTDLMKLSNKEVIDITMVGGIGMALTEQVQIDHTTGQIINSSFGTYQVPLHSMIPHIDVWFVDKPDYNVNPIGAKGLGEIALIGFAAAVANAVYNATGKRLRDLPITPEKINLKKV